MLRHLARRVRYYLTSSEPNISVRDTPSKRGGPLMSPVEENQTAIHIEAPRFPRSNGVYIPVDAVPTLRETTETALTREDTYFVEFAVISSETTPVALSPFCAACHKRIGTPDEALMIQQHTHEETDIDAVTVHYGCIDELFDAVDEVYEEEADVLLGEAL